MQYAISPGVTLTCVKTDKFKTGCLSVNLITGLSRETAAHTALLPRVLRRGTARLPDMQRLSEELDTLYGARLEAMVRKKGELHCVGFFSDFLNDDCIPDGGETLLEKAAALVGEALFDPDMRDGLLRTDYVESERKLLIDDIRAAINDKRGYSIDRLIEEMCGDEPFGIGYLGGEQEAEAITPQSLTEHYRKLLAQSRIEIFYCGSAEPSRVETAVRTALQGLPERTESGQPMTEVILVPKTDKPRRFIEELDIAQGKLTVGFRVGEAMMNPDYPALMVFNAIYGGSVTSKLFLNVREKLSLCYFASSMLHRHKGVMVVSSGVDFSKFNVALDEIIAQLDNVKNGDISEWELNSSKLSLMTAIKSALDKPTGLEDLYLDSAIAAVKYTPDELCAGVENVTKDDIVRIASGVMVDSVYFLTGKGVSVNEA